MARDLKHREARGELKQFTRNSGGKAVVERFLRDVDHAISRQNKLEGCALPLITQQHQQNGHFSDVFPERILDYFKFYEVLYPTGSQDDHDLNHDL